MANLTLARATGRTREFAIRIALGAGRRRLIRQLLTESLLLALAGGGLGLLVASWGLQGALKVLPEALPRAPDIRLDVHVLLFTLAASVLAGILFGFAPALKTSATTIQETLKEGSRGSSAARHRTQAAFVVVEVGLAVVLLAGAGLMIRSLAKLRSVNPGFAPHNVLMFSSSFPPIKSPDAIRANWREIYDKLTAIPGVRAASVTVGAAPLQNDSVLPFWLEGQPKPATDASMKLTLFYLVQPDYLKVMRIPLERGRFLAPADNAQSPLITVIDDRFAQLYFHDQNPIGKRVNFAILNTTAEIVGVVGHVKQRGLDENSRSSVPPQCYLPIAQLPDKFMPLLAGAVGVVVRTAGRPIAHAASIRRAMDQVNSRQAMYDMKTMDDIISDSLSTQRFLMALMAVFAALALVMASIGIYGVISYVTSQRAHEIGIRMALGAERGDVLKMVLGEGTKMTLLGVAIGLATSWGLSRLLASLLFGISTHDPITFAGVAGLLNLVALAACYIPARRAANVDPMVSLRRG